MSDQVGHSAGFDADIVVIGAGAAGLMSAIHAARAARQEFAKIIPTTDRGSYCCS